MIRQTELVGANVEEQSEEEEIETQNIFVAVVLTLFTTECGVYQLLYNLSI